MWPVGDTTYAKRYNVPMQGLVVTDKHVADQYGNLHTGILGRLVRRETIVTKRTKTYVGTQLVVMAPDGTVLHFFATDSIEVQGE